MDSGKRYEAESREIFYRRYEYIELLKDQEFLTIKEIHEPLGKNDRQVKRELEDLEKKDYITFEKDGRNLNVKLTEKGKRQNYFFNEQLKKPIYFIDDEYRDRISELLDRYYNAKNHDVEKLSLRYIHDALYKIQRDDVYIDWSKEQKVKDFVYQLIDNINEKNIDLLYDSFEIIVNLFRMGYYDQETINKIKKYIKDEEIENNDKLHYVINYSIGICIKLLTDRPEHKEEAYKFLLFCIKKIIHQKRDDFTVFTNYRSFFFNIPEDIKKLLTNELFEILNNKKTNEKMEIVEEILKLI